MPSAASLTVLHLSDLQFGSKHRFEPEGAVGDAACDTLFERLKQDLLELRDQLRPDVVVLTGDLAEQGKTKEFDQVASFAAKLGELLELERRRVLVVPGNHDVNPDLCESYFSKCKAHDEAPVEPYWEKWECYHSFFVKFYSGIDDYVFREDQPWTMFELPDLDLVVAGLNSTMAESHRSTDHFGKVGEKQLKWFAERLGQRNQWLRLGIVHHNPFRNEADDDEHLHDARDMERVLGPHLQLVLHGHRHQARVHWWGPRLPILATGSTAVTVDARSLEVPNQYQFIRLERDRVRWFTRMYAPDIKRFVADSRHSVDGNGWQHEEKVEFPQLGSSQQVTLFDDGFTRHPRTRNSLVEHMIPIIRARHREVLDLRHLDDAEPAGAYVHLTATPEPGVLRQVFIAVIDGPVTVALLETFRIRVVNRYRVEDAHAVFELIHRGDIQDDARERAGRLLIRVYSVAQYQGLPDLRPVVLRMLERLDSEQEYAQHLYVPQRMTSGLHGQATVSDALQQFIKWLHTTNGVLALVLGEFGTGKTFLLRQLARALGRAHIDDNGPLIPLFIEMRQLDRSHNLDDLIGQTLQRAGVEVYDIRVLQHLIEQGHIVLLFDGFDELVLRVTYKRAADHLDTVLRAAQGQAKVIISSRTQHFLRDEQATSLLDQARSASVHLHVARLLGFDEHQIERFLNNKLGDVKGPTKLARMRKIEDLVGLANNPRLLDFIADLDDDLLLAAKQAANGTEITPSKIYELLVGRWLGHEAVRQHPKGSVPGVRREDCEHALSRVALLSWAKTEPFVTLGELEGEVRATLVELSRELDTDVTTQAIGSGTLLVRDNEERFRFVHQSIMEWLVAREIAQAFTRGEVHEGLTQRLMSPLSVGFLLDLADRDQLAEWARSVLRQGQGGPRLHENALAVRERMGLVAESPLQLAGRDLRGESLGRDLRGADLRDADLRGMRLARVDLRGADLRGARLSHAILDGADLREANLGDVDFEAASLLNADLRGVTWGKTSLRRAALLGAKLDPTPPDVDLFGAATDAKLARCRTEHSVSGPCAAVASSPDGRLLATAVGVTIVVREFESGREVAVLEGHTGTIWSVAFSSDGALLASGGEDGKVRVWNVEGYQPRASLEGHTGTIWSVAWSSTGELASAGEDGKVRVWDVKRNRVRASLKGDRGTVWSVAWSSEGGQLASGNSDGTVRVWDLKRNRARVGLKGHTGIVSSVAWSSAGQLASGGSDGKVRVWEAAGNRVRASLEGHTGRVWSVAWSKEGQLASGGSDGKVRVWDVESTRARASLEGHAGRVRSVAWSSEGGQLASSAEDGKVRVWDVNGNRARASLEGYVKAVSSVAWSSEGGQLASGGEDGKVRVWDIEGNHARISLEGHSGIVWSVAWSTMGGQLASGGEDGKVRVWDVNGNREPVNLESHTGWVCSVAWSSEGRLASGGSDGKVRVWDVDGNRVRVRSLEGHARTVWSVAWSSQGAQLASGGDDGKVRVWDVESNRVRASLEGHRGRVWTVAWSSEGRWIASGGDDGVVRVWDVDKDRAQANLLGHTGRVRSVSWSSETKYLASGGDDGAVRIWTWAQGEWGPKFTCRTIVGIPGLVPQSIAFHPRHRTLWVSGSGGFTAILAGDTFEHRASLLVTDTGSAIFTPDGRYRVEGDIGEALWQRVGLHRFALGRLDPYLPHPARLPDDWRAE